MSSYVGSSYQKEYVAYSQPTPIAKPVQTQYVPSGCAPYAAPVAHHHKKTCYPGYSETGIILVLFILLVIISRAWRV